MPMYAFTADYSPIDWLIYGAVALAIVVGFFAFMRWAARVEPIPSVGEAQAIGQAPPGRPVKTLTEYYGGLAAAHRKAGGFQDPEPDETDGADEDRVVEGDDDQYPHGRLAIAAAPAMSGAELAEQVRRDHEIKDEPVLFHEVVSATGCYPMLDDAVLHSGMTGAFTRLTPEVLAALDAQRLVAEVAA